MFPEIVREDVFRLETRRLWLCWPTVDEGAAKPDMTSPGAGRRAATPESSTGDPYRSLGPPEFRRMRQDNASGAALHLLLTGRGDDRRPFGVVSLTPVRERLENCGLLLQVSLAAERRGAGLMTEAVQAVVDAAFMLSATPLVAASARVLDPAFRRVLEKSGFAYCGTGLDAAVGGAGLVASDRLRLDRKAWVSLKAWRVPAVVRRRPSGEGPRPDCP